ncbi:hypothetical protein [Chitinophaga ginsengisoli]|uniref:Uncharacterized protein n=1 Tax=Chitinophaga ginsengisoli TaxID=363837 RepID=A0A2P8G9R1_9BACT|nr:hypothetical protein [Chitinophaga ginsengisoli]PSL30707.1 hypothetical protein CLV42_10568 [Chitinophaga ginsengisoli]
MARTKNPLFTGVKMRRGKIAPGFILKTRGEKAFISKCPDMSNVVPSELQLEYKHRFRAAVEYAKSIISDPRKKAVYKVRKGSTVYHSAIKDYLEK